MIRPARADDLEYLPEIERAAGEQFRGIGMAAVADDDLPTVEELAAFQRDGRAWVADDDGLAVGYVLVTVIDGSAHVEQVSVHPGHARRRLGQQLLAAVAQWARSSSMPAMTLMTFSDVPWNAPYYERIGWRVLQPTELSRGLKQVMEEEAARGLNRWPRVAMRFELTS